MGMETIQLRVDEVTRRRIEAAARLSGKSLVAFIVGAAKAQAKDVQPAQDQDRGAALAAYYRTRRFESLERHSWEHLHPGYVPVDTVANQLDWDIDDTEWDHEVDQLMSTLDTFAAASDPDGTQSESEGKATQHPLGLRRNDRKAIDNVFLFNPVPGRVIDLCASGLGVETRDALPLAKQDFFSIGDDAMVRAKIRAQVRWCRLARTESRSNGDVISIYRSGVEFVDARALP
jgi:hypothetical protein